MIVPITCRSVDGRESGRCEHIGSRLGRLEPQQLGQRHQLPVQPIRVTKETLLTADELFLTNSIIGVWPVKQMDNKSFSVGQLSRQFCKWFNEFKEQDIAGG